jgi:O-succinylbenzoic acid--CoA ligase
MIKSTDSQHWLIEKALHFPNKLAIQTNSQNFTFEQLVKASLAVKMYLTEHGIKREDNVCILADHDFRFWIIVNALWLMGAVPVPINIKNTEEEIEWQFQKVDSKYLIDLRENKSSYAAVYCLSFENFNFFNTERNDTVYSQFDFSHLHSAIILFTSGSTGKPKAVLHTFKSLYESAIATATTFDLNKKDIWLASLPLYHIGGIMILVRSLLTESLVVFPNSLKQNDIVESINKSNPTHISFVSTTFKRILASNQNPNKNLKYVFLGGGHLSNDLCRDAIKSGFPVVKVYGSTETCSMVCVLKPEDFNKKFDSVGIPINEKINIIVSNGDIFVSSPTLFKEYYNDEEITKLKVINNFYQTGDLGKLDDDGFLYIDSRREDIIISGGENVSVKEIEISINSIPNVTDCFVFGLKDETWGQIICAAIVSNDYTAEKLKSILQNKLASYKIPKKIFFVTEIPRNEMGKIMRSEFIHSLKLDEV